MLRERAKIMPPITRVGLLVVTGLMLSVLAQAQEQRPLSPPPAPRPVYTSSAARLTNADEVRRHLGLTPAYDHLAGLKTLKVAVLDYGFDGVGGPRRYLPEDTVVVEHYNPELVRRFNLGDPEYRKSFAPHNAHGRLMAQIIWAATGSDPHGPKFYLLNANGPTMLRRAARYAIEAKVDVILFGGTFEGGGNGDGRGPINRVVADALAADIIWINAAGNYGRHVYNGPVDILPSGYLRLGKGTDETALRFRNLLDENTVTVTLSWNDYREQEDAGTDKDLDLNVEDWLGWVVGSSETKQVAKPGEIGPQESRNPRERVVLPDLAASRDNDYLIRIKAKSRNFTADDRVRVLITSSREGFLDPKTGAPTEAIQFLDASRKGEIYPPADNPLVLTVGDPSPHSAVGPTADHRRKPDIILEDSTAAFTNGDLTAGASNAAAYFAGVVTLMKAAEPGLCTRHLLWFAHHDSATRVAPSGSSAMASTPAPASASLSQLSLPREVSSAPAGASYYGQARAPMDRPSPSARFRVGNVELNLSGLPRRALPASSVSGSRARLRQGENLRVMPREVDRPTATAGQVWRTPTREHLAEIVGKDKSK
jgi:hypothetical protein